MGNFVTVSEVINQCALVAHWSVTVVPRVRKKAPAVAGDGCQSLGSMAYLPEGGARIVVLKLKRL